MDFIITSAKVGLAKLERQWFDMAVSWMNDLIINRTLVTAIPWPMNIDDIENWLGNTNPPMAFFVFDLHNTNKPIGLSHIHSYESASRSVKLAALIETSQQNKGFGTEAVKLMVDYSFSRFDIHRVALTAFASNPSGLRAYEKVGFIKEVMRKRAWFRHGQWYDDVIMSILRSEWVTMKK